MWCWRRLLRIPWTARRSNQSILKYHPWIFIGCWIFIQLHWCWSWNSNTLDFGHLMWRTDSFEKTLMLWKIESRGRGQQRMRWLHGIPDSIGHVFESTPGIDDGQGGLACCSPWSRKELDTTEQLNWTLLKETLSIIKSVCLSHLATEKPKPGDKYIKQVAQVPTLVTLLVNCPGSLRKRTMYFHFPNMKLRPK